MSIDPTSYRAQVSNTVDPDIYFDETEDEENRGAAIVEILARIGEDVIGQENKVLTLLVWLWIFDSLPLFIRCLDDDPVFAIAQWCVITRAQVHGERKRLIRDVSMRDVAGEVDVISVLLRNIGESTMEKRNKVLRFLAWLYILQALPTGIKTLDDIGLFCGVGRQAVNKDLGELKDSHPELGINTAVQERHRIANRSNIKLK